MSQFTETYLVSVFRELKSLGVKVPKTKKLVSSILKQASPAPPSNNKIFGISINMQEKVEVEKCLLPKFIVMSTNFLKQYLKREGLFRIAGSVKRQKLLRLELENGKTLERAEPHDVASLMKQWLRELPERLIPAYLTDLFIRCLHLEIEDNRISALSLCCNLLPIDHFCTLKHLLVFLFELSQNYEKNKMGSRNLAVVMAPNIFLMGSIFIDKSSNDLMEQYTAVIELLIKNVHRIQPPCHLAEAGTLKCDTDLDVSRPDITDTLPLPDISPSKLKKGVQDLIKKLVGKNSVSPARKRPYQEDFVSDTRQATGSTGSSVIQDESLSYTPNTKIPKIVAGTDKKSRKRGKSFNLLKRKEKKRQKGEKSNGLTSKLNVSTSSPLQENLVSSLQIQALAENKEFSFTLQSISPMSSEGCLPAENIPSPCLNNTLKAEHQMDYLKAPEVSFSKDCEKISESQKTGNSSFVRTIEKSVSDTEIIRSKVKHINDGVLRNISVESNVTSAVTSQLRNEKIRRNCTIARQEAFIIKPKNSRRNTINHLVRADSVKIAKAKNSQLKIIHQNNTQKDKIKKSDSNSIAQVFSDVKINENNQSSNDKKCPKRTVRNASIVRGRPNTVKTGLPNDVCSRYNSDSVSYSNKHKAVSVSSSVDNDLFINAVQKNDLDLSTINQMQNLTLSPKKTISEKEDEFKVEAANFYDQIIMSIENNVSKIEITNSNDKITNSASVTETASVKSFVETDIDNGINVGSIIVKVEEPELIKIDDSKTVSKRKSKEKLCSDSDNKVQNPKNSSKVFNFNSFVEHSDTTKPRTAEKLRAVKSSSPRKSCEKRGNFSDITDNKNQNSKDSQQQTYLDVKTVRVVKSSILEPESLKTDDTKTRSKRKGRERLCSNSVSEVHNTKKKSEKVSRINSFSEQATITKPRKVKKLRAVKSFSPRKSREKAARVSENTDKENQCSVKSQKQIHLDVKTPKNQCESPELWFSGSKLHKAEEAVQKGNPIVLMDTKRENVTDNENQHSKDSQQQTYLDVKTVKIVKSSSLEPKSIKTDDNKTQPKRKSRERLCSNSNSEVHNAKKKSEKVSRINSFSEQATITKPRKVKKLRAVKSLSPRKSCEKVARVSENTDRENQCIEKSQKQIYLNVKTPKNKCESPEQWFSGRKFLEAQEAVQKENEMDNKRESIAMILRNNKGHVREKASIYEPDTRTTPMLLRNSTPCRNFCDTQYSNMQSSQKKSTSARSTRSTRRNSPSRLPPIPLFFESSPAASTYSHPLKELTNLSNSEEIFFTPPDKKSFNSSQNGESSFKDQNTKCTLKPKMNSFSGHTPFKLPLDRNKVRRSQSSPKSLHPLCNEKYYCSPILKAKSALSIERLKSDELLDEWNCEM